jgi:hypothetical protein
VKQRGRETNHSTSIQCRGQEYVDLYLHSPNTPSWRGDQLKRRDNFTFTFHETVTWGQFRQARWVMQHWNFILWPGLLYRKCNITCTFKYSVFFDECTELNELVMNNFFDIRSTSAFFTFDIDIRAFFSL